MRLPGGKEPVSETASLIGRNIVRLRYKKGIEQRSLASSIGMSAGALCDIENARRRVLAQNLHKIALYFEVPMDTFFTSTGENDEKK